MNAHHSSLQNSNRHESQGSARVKAQAQINAKASAETPVRTQDTKPLVIIPAAGYGTRVGSPEAKELNQGPNGSPLIHLALEQARKRQWPVHVITRSEKKSLIQYLEIYHSETQLPIQIQEIEPSREWPDSILKSQAYWQEKNLLVLPDTVYEPTSLWDSLAQSNEAIAAAVFETQDYSKWGVFRQAASGETEICEKPRDQKTQMKAWGLICFSKNSGEELLKAQLESTFDHKWRKLSVRAELFELSSFQDVTRG